MTHLRQQQQRLGNPLPACGFQPFLTDTLSLESPPFPSLSHDLYAPMKSSSLAMIHHWPTLLISVAGWIKSCVFNGASHERDYDSLSFIPTIKTRALLSFPSPFILAIFWDTNSHPKVIFTFLIKNLYSILVKLVLLLHVIGFLLLTGFESFFHLWVIVVVSPNFHYFLGQIQYELNMVTLLFFNLLWWLHASIHCHDCFEPRK